MVTRDRNKGEGSLASRYVLLQGNKSIIAQAPRRVLIFDHVNIIITLHYNTKKVYRKNIRKMSYYIFHVKLLG